jgi:hypothetical protein
VGKQNVRGERGTSMGAIETSPALRRRKARKRRREERRWAALSGPVEVRQAEKPEADAKPIDMADWIGRRFGRLVVLSEAERPVPDSAASTSAATVAR